MTSPSPIALFVFNRPEHTATTLKALAENELAEDSELTIFCDGPRTTDDSERVDAVRALVRDAGGFKGLHVVERPENLGLARSIIAGVSEMLEAHETVIVVEDDLTTSPYFLRFMNDGLQQYSAEDRVVSICGYSYPSEKPLPETFFLPGAHCWGWATWRRAWDLFEPDSYKLLKRLDEEDLIYSYDIDGSFSHTQWLQMTAAGQGDSWALRWMASAIVNDRLTLYPGLSLVHNTGMDSSGTNAGKRSNYDTTLSQRSPHIERMVPKTDRGALDQRKAFHIALRRRHSWKWSLYYRIASLLPPPLEKMIYSSIVRRLIRRFEKA